MSSSFLLDIISKSKDAGRSWIVYWSVSSLSSRWTFILTFSSRKNFFFEPFSMLRCKLTYVFFHKKTFSVLAIHPVIFLFNFMHFLQVSFRTSFSWQHINFILDDMLQNLILKFYQYFVLWKIFLQKQNLLLRWQVYK